jgi:DivIVA domain-containing protein
VLTLLVVLAVAVVLFLAAALATSDRALLADVPADDPDVGLPDGRVDPVHVVRVRFSMALRGYRMADVDRVLDRLGQELAERDGRISELESAIADAVRPAVEDFEHAQERQARAQVAAELAAAREEAPPAAPAAPSPVVPAPVVPAPVVPAPVGPTAAVTAVSTAAVSWPPVEPAPVPVPPAPPIEPPSTLVDDTFFPAVEAPAPAAASMPEATDAGGADDTGWPTSQT